MLAGSEDDEDEKLPCPEPWLERFMALVEAAKTCNCSVLDLYYAPPKFKLMALRYQKILDDAKPMLEVLGKQRAEAEAKEKEFLESG